MTKKKEGAHERTIKGKERGAVQLEKTEEDAAGAHSSSRKRRDGALLACNITAIRINERD